MAMFTNPKHVNNQQYNIDLSSQHNMCITFTNIFYFIPQPLVIYSVLHSYINVSSFCGLYTDWGVVFSCNLSLRVENKSKSGLQLFCRINYE